MSVKRTASASKYFHDTLSEANIDAASQMISDFLAGESITSKDALRIRLSAEEVLLQYLKAFGNNSFTIRTSKRFRTCRIELTVTGNSMDPFAASEEEESAFARHLLAGFGLAPVWRYKNGRNIITFTLQQKKKISQIAQLGIAICSAFAFGELCNVLPANISDFLVQDLVTPVFNTFMGMLSAIAGPIIFLSVVWGICGIGDMATFGKIGKKMISRFVGITFIVGILAALLFLPFFPISDSGGTAFAFSNLFQMILDIVPSNMFAPFLSGNSMQIIFIAIAAGLAMLVLGNRIPQVYSLIDQLNQVMQLLMNAVSSLIPFFVFGSIFNMVAGNNLSAILRSYKLILVTLFVSLILMAVYFSIVVISKKVNPMLLLKKLIPTFVIGLTTASSMAAFSTNVDTCQHKLGIDKKLIDIGLPLGQVIFMPGALIIFLAATVGMAEVYGIAITPVWMVTLVMIAVVLAIAAPPVPGAAITIYTILFMQLNIPAEAVAVVIALNVILEFVATATNLFCLQTEMILLSGKLNKLDHKTLRK